MSIIRKILVAFVVGCTLFVVQAGPSLAGGKSDPLIDMFVWWNNAYKEKDGFTTEAFSHYFTKDAVMRINGKVSSSGIEDMAAHFRQIQARTQMVEIVLPFIDEFKSPDGSKIFTYHIVKARENDKDSAERVMGYAEIRDGKISLINFLSVNADTGAADK